MSCREGPNSGPAPDFGHCQGSEGTGLHPRFTQSRFTFHRVPLSCDARTGTCPTTRELPAKVTTPESTRFHTSGRLLHRIHAAPGTAVPSFSADFAPPHLLRLFLSSLLVPHRILHTLARGGRRVRAQVGLLRTWQCWQGGATHLALVPQKWRNLWGVGPPQWSDPGFLRSAYGECGDGICW